MIEGEAGLKGHISTKGTMNITANCARIPPSTSALAPMHTPSRTRPRGSSMGAVLL